MVALLGCPAGSDYVEPGLPTPEAWSQGGGAKLNERELRTWWRTFGDGELTGLVDRAVKGSPQLRLAASRLEEARAMRGVTESGRFPTLDAGASFERGRYAMRGRPDTNTLYSGSFDSAWEVDLFGKIRRQAQAAEAQLQASEEDYYDVLVTLTAEVALNYVEVRAFQKRLAVAEENRAAQRRVLDLVKDSFEAGEVSRLDMEQAQTNVETTESQIPLLEMSLAQARHRLAVLVGLPPASLDGQLGKVRGIPMGPRSIAVGVPAEVMRRRADVRRAERQLAAQWARVGAAKAELYPSLQLAGTVGLESIGMGTFLKGSSVIFGVGPSVRWNIFSGGRVRQMIKVETARQEQALIGYEAAILDALRDVEDAIVAYGKEMVRRESLARAEQSARRTVELAESQYRGGESGFLPVLDAQRSLFQAQDELVRSEAEVTTNLIRLYKALGGGWVNRKE
jgi:NodT family efflux transporter outer membrane factor (OMF) lipoprotein